MMCKNVHDLVDKKKFEEIAKVLENGSYKLKDCQKFPDTVILLLEGYTKSVISEKRVLAIFGHLSRKGVFTQEFKERIKCLQAYSDLKENLSKRIIFELI